MWGLSAMAGDDVAPGKYRSLPYEGVEPAEQDDVMGRLEAQNRTKTVTYRTYFSFLLLLKYIQHEIIMFIKRHTPRIYTPCGQLSHRRRRGWQTALRQHRIAGRIRDGRRNGRLMARTLLPRMETFTDGSVGQRRRWFVGQFIALGGEHSQRSAPETGMVLESRMEKCRYRYFVGLAVWYR